MQEIIEGRSSSEQTKDALNKDFYFIDLNSFTSIRKGNKKSIILTGFNEEETARIINILEDNVEVRNHVNTGMYVLEKKDEKD